MSLGFTLGCSIVFFSGLALGLLFGYAWGERKGKDLGYLKGFEKAQANELEMKMAMDTRYTSPDC